MARNQRIKEALKSRGVSQTLLAKELQVSHATVNERLNKDEDIDSVEFIRAVAKLTGFSFAYLLTGNSPKYSKAWDGAFSEEGTPVIEEPATLIIPAEAWKKTAESLQTENEKLKFEIEILRSALREIGAGSATKKEL